jgi:very-short-patch-repair endonuclease
VSSWRTRRTARPSGRSSDDRAASGLTTGLHMGDCAMSGPRTPLPSPLAGEGAERRRREAGEGTFETPPSPGRPLRSRLPSPARGEGREQAASAKPSVATVRARSLRSNMTDAERKLWFALRDRRFANFKFRRQVPVGPFIADLICYHARVVIEVDGGQHSESPRDEQRDRWLAANDFFVLRFWNNEVLSNLEGVMTKLLDILRKRTPHPARAARGRPSPARGEGIEPAARETRPTQRRRSDGVGER